MNNRRNKRNNKNIKQRYPNYSNENIKKKELLKQIIKTNNYVSS